MRIQPLDLMNFFKDYGNVIEELPVAEAELNRLIKLIDRENYRQLFYENGINHLLVLIEYFERREEYTTCETILFNIKELKRTSGENYPTHF